MRKGNRARVKCKDRDRGDPGRDRDAWDKYWSNKGSQPTLLLLRQPQSAPSITSLSHRRSTMSAYLFDLSPFLLTNQIPYLRTSSSG